MKPLALLLLFVASAVGADIPGMPGFATTHGGRGGKVIRVSTLAPDGEGSLREALRAKGPRIVVFVGTPRNACDSAAPPGRN